ncbi:MAG: hypothetical protein M3044_14045 [Thermoproteota archaeon]|nr:hypothetical protein [Thermoproteota archaeon]
MKNKAVLSALVIVVIISGAFSIVATKQTVLAQQTTTTNFLPNENPTYGIKAQYPSS